METRQLGKSGPQLSTVGFGAWAIGGGDWGFGWGTQDDKDSIAAIHKALDIGVNWIDTAAVYGLGHSETVVGRAIKGRRDDLVVATKGGLVWDGEKTVTKSLDPASLSKEIEDSLRRLDIDVIDLYQIHWPTKGEGEIEAGIEAIAKFVEAGKIRHIGVSNFKIDQMKRAQSVHPITSLQPPYNMFRRKIEAETLAFCKDQGIGILCYSPMGSGLLTGKYNKDTLKDLADNDWRKTKSPEFLEPRFGFTLELLDQLRPIAEKYDRSLAQLAVAWCLRRQEITGAIVGARRPHQIEETAKASGWVLDAADLETIEKLLAERNKKVEAALAGQE